MTGDKVINNQWMSETYESQETESDHHLQHLSVLSPLVPPFSSAHPSAASSLYSEQSLDQELELIVSQDPKVQKLEQELDDLKKLNLNKKDLQVKRNRLTAQLSRDKKKAEGDYLKEKHVEMKRIIMDIQNRIDTGEICQNCITHL